MKTMNDSKGFVFVSRCGVWRERESGEKANGNSELQVMVSLPPTKNRDLRD
jgi:hypothetical protein